MPSRKTKERIKVFFSILISVIFIVSIVAMVAISMKLFP